MLTFRDLQLEVLRWIDEGDDTDTTLTLVKEALNRSHRRLLASRTWPFMLWPKEVSFATVAGQRAYALKHGVSKVLTVYDQATATPLPLISRREWEGEDVQRAESVSVPQGAIYGDIWPVAIQPTGLATSLVKVLSTSASDTGGPAIALVGLNTDGDLTSETVTVNGAVTPVASTTAWSHLISVSKTGTWVGSAILSTPDSALAYQTILTLTASEYGKQYPTLEFIETPSEARTYLYTAQRTPLKLVNDYDIPDTPYPFSELHVYDALLDLTAYNTELGSKEQRLWKAKLDDLEMGLLHNVDEGIAGSRPRFVRRYGASNRQVISQIPA